MVWLRKKDYETFANFTGIGETTLRIDVLGANIPRVDESIKQQLLDAGLIYIGEDNELNVREQKNIPTPTTKSE